MMNQTAPTQWPVQFTVPANVNSANVSVTVPPEIRVPAGGNFKWMRIRDCTTWREGTAYTTNNDWNFVRVGLSAPGVKSPFSVAGTDAVGYNDALLVSRLTNRAYGPSPWVCIENQIIPTVTIISVATMTGTVSATPTVVLLSIEFSQDEVPPLTM